MSADWAGVAVTVLIAAVTGAWAVLRWSREQKADRDQRAELTDALYLVPFAAAADDLQSRLYNLLRHKGLVALRTQEPKGRYAAETLYLLARFFAWEQQLLRFTYLATDVGVVEAAKHVRKVLATSDGGIDSWCFFRTTQTALGQSVLVWRDVAGGIADTISIVEFERQLSAGLAHDLGLDRALQALRSATVIDELGERTVRRLEDLDAAVGAMIDAVAEHLKQRRDGVSVIRPSGSEPG